MKRILLAVMFTLAVAAPLTASVSAPVAPDQTARGVTDQILKLIRANRDSYAADYRKLYAMVDQYVLPHFDFRRMAQQVLGPAWRNASAEQRDKFTKEFRDLLVRTYATALLKYNNQEIVYQPLRLDPAVKQVVVRSTIKPSDGAPSISINYSFYLKDDNWKIYDMAIEGPSIVTTYQRVYAERLHKGTLDDLIAALAEENKRAAGGGTGK